MVCRNAGERGGDALRNVSVALSCANVAAWGIANRTRREACWLLPFSQVLLCNPVCVVLFAYTVINRPAQPTHSALRAVLSSPPLTPALNSARICACPQSAQFFASRIVFEERHLSRLFGEEYTAYACRTPTRIPLLFLWGNFN